MTRQLNLLNTANDTANHMQTVRTLIQCEYFSVINRDSDEIIRINAQAGVWEEAKKSTITNVIGKPNNHNSSWRINLAKLEYRPDIPFYKFMSTSEAMVVLNAYRPPEYLKDAFWGNSAAGSLSPNGGAIRSQFDLFKLPDAYKFFFNHLTSSDQDSFDYLIDWLAFAINPNKRNLTTLVLISKPGTGKGVFYDCVLQPLFGVSNAVLLRGQDSLKSRFNASYANKRLIFFDEAQLTDQEALNRFKAFANTTIEIEQKGKDPTYIKNWANTVLAANELNAIYIEPGDRRFSVIDVADQRLDAALNGTKWPNVAELRAELEEPDNIRALYEALIEYMPTRNMNYAFTSAKRASEIKEAGLTEWERAALDYLSDLYAKGRRSVLLEEVQRFIKERADLRSVPGRVKFARLFETYPNIGTLKFDAKQRKLFIEILGSYSPIIGVAQGSFINNTAGQAAQGTISFDTAKLTNKK